MANTPIPGIDPDDVQDFWQTAHQHVVECLEAFGRMAQPLRISALEGKTHDWFLGVHALCHQVDEETEMYVLPQCDPNRFLCVYHDPATDALWMSK